MDDESEKLASVIIEITPSKEVVVNSKLVADGVVFTATGPEHVIALILLRQQHNRWH